MSARTVDIPQSVLEDLKNFRFKNAKGTTAISIKIVKSSLTMAVDEEFEDQSIEEIAEELPESGPRYVLISHELVSCVKLSGASFTHTSQKHPDGRISYPIILINWAPPSSPIGLMTLHASALSYFHQVSEVSKVLEVRDGAEGLTTQAVNEKLLGN
ncbi:hypothetical protein B9479_000463 [Cryptococcus floricola]|uniref:ADF-H domain-containing protein n=1 Tax=Cryptococcus floricola TaxID=2591691 RepID=A0A5D3B6I6_9TREE|nr:hypothetical protein B9479_000463 [Cryptococcus floricola]